MKYQKYIEKDAALERRFARIQVSRTNPRRSRRNSKRLAVPAMKNIMA